jgi:DNA repair exonuclease SbcCD nuclease subunit
MAKLFQVESTIDQVIFLSDVHFGARSGSIEWLQNMKDYFDNFFIPFIKKSKKAKHKPCVVIAGDYFDNRQSIDINVMNVAIDTMQNIAKECKVFMVIGNHDIYKKSDTDITSLRPMTDIKNVTVIYDQMELEIKDGKKFLLTSWVGDFKKENKIISDEKNNYDILVFHTELSGMSYDNGRKILNGINMDIVDDDKIVSGHIHKRQESKKGIYLGSPYHITRSDIGNKKGIYTFTVNDGSIVREFTENDYSPEYVLERFAAIGRNPEDWKDIVSNNYVYIIFTSDELDVVNVNKFISELQEYKPRNIELIEERTKVDVNNPEVSMDENGEVIDLNVSPDATVEEIFEKKVKAFKLTKKDEKEVNKINVEYLKRAAEELAL